MKDFTLYTVPQSRGGMVLWMLEECGADYDTVVLSYDSVKSPDYLAVNPMGKVPALKHRGQVTRNVIFIRRGQALQRTMSL